MITINEHYRKLNKSYLFVDIAKRVREFQDAHPDTEVIKLGIGDVTRPLPPAATRTTPLIPGAEAGSHAPHHRMTHVCTRQTPSNNLL